MVEQKKNFLSHWSLGSWLIVLRQTNANNVYSNRFVEKASPRTTQGHFTLAPKYLES